MDWLGWHGDYDRPDSSLSRRLRAVQARVREALDAAPPGPLRAVSACAGQGRDLIEVLADHPRRDDVRARLVEIDPRLTAIAAERATAAGLTQVEIVTADAARTDRYADLTPAHLVLLCGIFGNITDTDVERTVATATALCRPGGTVVWTRSRTAPDRFPLICRWFEERGFARHWVSAPDAGFGVAAHRFHGTPRPLPTTPMFSFTSHETLNTST